MWSARWELPETRETSQQPRQEDWTKLRDILQKHHLGALNTYGTWRHTFVGKGPNGQPVATRIDYVFMRLKLLDEASRTCQYLDAFILSAHRSTAQHVPMVCSIRAAWTPWKPARVAAEFKARDRQRLRILQQQFPKFWEQRIQGIKAEMSQAADMPAAVQIQRQDGTVARGGQCGCASATESVFAPGCRLEQRGGRHVGAVQAL